MTQGHDAEPIADAFTRAPAVKFSTPGSPASRVEADYEETQAKLRLESKACRHCKAAKTRARGKVEAVVKAHAEQLARWNARRPGRYDPEYIAERLAEERAEAERVAEERMCGRHAERRRLNYACSPVSETYWTS